MNRPDHNTYQSPFTWRYSSDAMRLSLIHISEPTRPY